MHTCNNAYAHAYIHAYIHPETHRHRDRGADTVAGKHMGMRTYIHRGNGAEIHISTQIYKHETDTHAGIHAGGHTHTHTY